MRCFIHSNEDAVAVCIKCGKAMCVDCSAYSNHTGVCPICKKNQILAKIEEGKNSVAKIKKQKSSALLGTILFCWTIIGIFIGLKSINKHKAELAKAEQQIKVAEGEVIKIQNALAQGGAGI